jgi:hypothetical protein
MFKHMLGSPHYHDMLSPFWANGASGAASVVFILFLLYWKNIWPSQGAEFSEAASFIPSHIVLPTLGQDSSVQLALLKECDAAVRTACEQQQQHRPELKEGQDPEGTSLQSDHTQWVAAAVAAAEFMHLLLDVRRIRDITVHCPGVSECCAGVCNALPNAGVVLTPYWHFKAHLSYLDDICMILWCLHWVWNAQLTACRSATLHATCQP